MITEILLKFFSIFLLLAVGVVLILGIGTLFKGGSTSKKHSNKLMQLRVLLQFIAILALVGFAYFFNHLINFSSSKSIDPIILANSLPFLSNKIEVGIPRKDNFFAKV